MSDREPLMILAEIKFDKIFHKSNLSPQTGGPEQRRVWKGRTSAVARGLVENFDLKPFFVIVTVLVCSNHCSYLFKSLSVYLLIHPGGWRGKQQCSHPWNPGETSSREKRLAQQDEGGGRQSFIPSLDIFLSFIILLIISFSNITAFASYLLSSCPLNLQAWLSTSFIIIFASSCSLVLLFLCSSSHILFPVNCFACIVFSQVLTLLMTDSLTQNENRMALISALDETSSLFTGTGKISTLGSLHRGESLVSDVSASLCSKCPKVAKEFGWWRDTFQLDADSPGVQSTSSYQSASTGEEVLSQISNIPTFCHHFALKRTSHFSDHIVLCHVQTKIVGIKENPAFVCCLFPQSISESEILTSNSLSNSFLFLKPNSQLL